MRRRWGGVALIVLAACGGKLVPEERRVVDDPPLPASPPDAGVPPTPTASAPPYPNLPLDPAPPNLDALAAAYAHDFVACTYDGGFIAMSEAGGEAGFAGLLAKGYVALLKHPGITLTQAQVDACVAQVTSAGCLGATPACAFTGLVPNGTGCIGDMQCASGYCADSPIVPDGTIASWCGVCTPYLGLGASCAQTGNTSIDTYMAPCAAGTDCFDGTCQTEVHQGDSCANAPCDAQTWCGPAGTCVPPAAIGAACTDGTTWCFPGSHCTDGVCTLPPKVEGATAGEACTGNQGESVNGVSILCTGQFECDATTSTCVPAPPQPVLDLPPEPTPPTGPVSCP